MLAILFVWFSFTGTVVIHSSELQRVLESFVSQQISLPKDDYTIEYRNVPNEVKIENVNYEIRVVPDRNFNLRGNVTLPVEILSGGKVEKRLLLSLKIRTFENVCFPTQQLNKQDVIKDEDIVIKRIETTSLTNPFISEKFECVGKRTKKTLMPGKPLLRSFIEDLPVVARGRAVKVFVQKNNVSVTMNGEAQQDGNEGEIISVRLTGSKDIVKAKVLDTQQVLLIQ
ncbi:MAG: flagellar basal body P-ring formation protein FlgA [Ignavibacteriales bacterium]|nr:flagellar basal body P-ring formation protein FlgA [Ignavibacteriales bacterium]